MNASFVCFGRRRGLNGLCGIFVCCHGTKKLLGWASFGDLTQQLRFFIVALDVVLDLELEMVLKLELE